MRKLIETCELECEEHQPFDLCFLVVEEGHHRIYLGTYGPEDVDVVYDHLYECFDGQWPLCDNGCHVAVPGHAGPLFADFSEWRWTPDYYRGPKDQQFGSFIRCGDQLLDMGLLMNARPDEMVPPEEMLRWPEEGVLKKARRWIRRLNPRTVESRVRFESARIDSYEDDDGIKRLSLLVNDVKRVNFRWSHRVMEPLIEMIPSRLPVCANGCHVLVPSHIDWGEDGKYNFDTVQWSWIPFIETINGCYFCEPSGLAFQCYDGCLPVDEFRWLPEIEMPDLSKDDRDVR